MKWIACSLLLGIPAAAPAAGTYYVSVAGSDTNPGTEAKPFRTLQRAADLLQPGEACVVRGGVYRESVRLTRGGAPGKPVRFTAAPGEKVEIRGTDPVEGAWTRHAGAIYRAAAPRAVPQLFLDDRLMVEARWPNCRFPEELWDRSKWAHAGPGSRYGRMVDPELSETGVDWTGGLATLNVAHQFYTWTRRVTRHAPGADAFEYPRDLEGTTSYADRTKPWESNRYFLSGKLAALDAPGEYCLDADTGALYLWALDGDDPSAHRVEVKARAYAFEGEGLGYVVISGFTLFGATLRLTDCRHCRVEACRLLYPTCAPTLDDPSAPEQWPTETLVSGSDNVVRRCHLAFSPTGGLSLVGEANLAEENLIHDVCWSGSLRYVPLRLSATAGTGADRPRGSIARRNTLHSFGNAGLAFGGAAHRIEYNHVCRGGLACKDVSLVYTQAPSCAGSVVCYNWVHGCRTEDGGGLGIRGDDQTRGLIVHHNVVWDCGRDGIIVKGDDNQVCSNTVLDIRTPRNPGNYVNLHTEKEPEKPWRKQFPLLARQNEHSRIHNNAALTLTGSNRGEPFPAGPNVSHNCQDADLRLRDPAHQDFRPRPDSPLVDAGCEIPGMTDGFSGRAPDIGAYEHGADPWRPGITWTPEPLP